MDRVTRATAQAPAVPEDLDTTDVEKVAGVVELPLHIRWSGPSRVYDMADRQDRARVYEQVLREGNATTFGGSSAWMTWWICGTS